MTHPVARVERPEGHRVIPSKARARAGGWLHVGAKVLTFANGEAFGTLSQVAVRASETAVGQGARRPAWTREGSGFESLVRRLELRCRDHGVAARGLGGEMEARGQPRRTRSLLLVTQSEL